MQERAIRVDRAEAILAEMKDEDARSQDPPHGGTTNGQEPDGDGGVARVSVMKPTRAVGIVGYGAYVPRYRLPAQEVNRVWHGGEDEPPLKEKAVPGLDEDTVTMSIEAARNALARAEIDPTLLRAVWVGSESHPYAVKPSSTIVAEAIGAGPET